MKKILFYIGYWLLSLTWGIIMTAIGAVIALALLITGHKPKTLGPNVYFEVGEHWGGMELGSFFLCDKTCSMHIKYHEAGHGLQNILYGPAMPFIVCIPSAIRYHYRNWLEKHNPEKYATLPDYDAIWFEGQATEWGTKMYEKKED